MSASVFELLDLKPRKNFADTLYVLAGRPAGLHTNRGERVNKRADITSRDTENTCFEVSGPTNYTITIFCINELPNIYTTRRTFPVVSALLLRADSRMITVYNHYNIKLELK